MPKTPHFFKANSRIGLTNKPLNQNEYNFGVEGAPDAILTTEFLKTLGNFKLDKFTFPNPEDIDPKDYMPVLASNLIAFKDLINENLKPGQTQIVIGGDNSVTFSSLLALIEINGVKNLGYIQFDSHGDLNLLNSSPSKNFHGMYLRPFFDNFDIPQINDLVPQKLTYAQALFIGDLNLDEDEPDFFASYKLRNIKRSGYLKKPAQILREIKLFSKNFPHIHINFDIDVFDSSLAGATGIPQDGKWKEEIFDILKILSIHPSISLDLCEVNPKKEGAQKTIKIAQKIIKNLLLDSK